MTALGKAAATAAARGAERRAVPPFSIGVISRGGAARNSISYGSDDVDVDRHWPPNRTTEIFGRMEGACPDAMTAYAKCVVEAQDRGALFKGACEEQFRAVMDCFRSVR